MVNLHSFSKMTKLDCKNLFLYQLSEKFVFDAGFNVLLMQNKAPNFFSCKFYKLVVLYNNSLTYLLLIIV